MGLIKYDDRTIIDAKNKISVCNDNIINALEKINNELVNMDRALNTPKSKPVIVSYTEYLNKKINLINNSKDSYNRMLTNISNEYNEYVNVVNEMVGGNVD